MRKITIIGAGYVGLVTGVCLAKLGNSVLCLDIDEAKIALLKSGKAPFFEPGLDNALLEESTKGSIKFTSSYQEALSNPDICFLALPTPSSENGSCDMRYVLSAAKRIGELMTSPLVIVNKSTVPVGTTEKVKQVIAGETEISFEVVSNPEFLKEGSALSDSLDPDRIILGVESPAAEKIMKELYTPFADRILTMDIASSELAKYAANAMLATRLSFMNHLSSLCEKVGADINAVRIAMGKDSRIGPRYLFPGVGFGGSCLPKDVRALKATFEEHQLSPAFFDAVLEINVEQQVRFLSKIDGAFESLNGKKLAIWGLSFKPGTDDLREAPSLYIIEKLLERGAFIKLYDPVAIPKFKELFPQSSQLAYCKDPYEAASNANAVILLTEWPEFKEIDFKLLGKIVSEKILFDGRNIYDKNSLDKENFLYHCIGKANAELVFSC